MLHIPEPAFCNDRARPAQQHPSGFFPEHWFPADVLSDDYGLLGLSFDYYINWLTKNFSKEDIWIKRIVDPNVAWSQTDEETLRRWIIDCDGENALVNWGRFRQSFKVKPRYMLFPDIPNPTIVSAVVSEDGTFEEIREVNIFSLMSGIKRRSGGPLRIGKKGLTVSTSALECNLAKTSSPWAGDLDLILLNEEDFSPVAIIELKKHNLDSPIENQKIANYYPKPDGRKYDRIALLSNQLTGTSIPIINIYYSTLEHFTEVKLERITSDFQRIQSVSSIVIPFTPNSIDDRKKFIQCLMTSINQLIV